MRTTFKHKSTHYSVYCSIIDITFSLVYFVIADLYLYIFVYFITSGNGFVDSQALKN